ncbi:DUF3789 domain-containing protein [Acerihabitans sp. TG2]
MTTLILVFMAGLFLGSTVGVFAMSLCKMAK